MGHKSIAKRVMSEGSVYRTQRQSSDAEAKTFMYTSQSRASDVEGAALQNKIAQMSLASSDECSICFEYYHADGHARTTRFCCKQEICTQCNHKSLLSGKCNFCRDEEHAFPEVHTRSLRG